jgi:N-carbamoylputrescine amidase
MKYMKVKVGLVQMSCVKDKETNIRKAETEIRKAANSGANIVCLQELFSSWLPPSDTATQVSC